MVQDEMRCQIDGLALLYPLLHSNVVGLRTVREETKSRLPLKDCKQARFEELSLEGAVTDTLPFDAPWSVAVDDLWVENSSVIPPRLRSATPTKRCSAAGVAQLESPFSIQRCEGYMRR